METYVNMLALYISKPFSAAEFLILRRKHGRIIICYIHGLTFYRHCAGLLFSRWIAGKIKHVSAYVIKRMHVQILKDQSIDHNRVQRLSYRVNQSQDQIRPNSMLTLFQIQCKITYKRPVYYSNTSRCYKCRRRPWLEIIWPPTHCLGYVHRLLNACAFCLSRTSPLITLGCKTLTPVEAVTSAKTAQTLC